MPAMEPFWPSIHLQQPSIKTAADREWMVHKDFMIPMTNTSKKRIFMQPHHKYMFYFASRPHMYSLMTQKDYNFTSASIFRKKNKNTQRETETVT